MTTETFQKNVELLELEPCENCETYTIGVHPTPEQVSKNPNLSPYSYLTASCGDHNNPSLRNYSHFKIGGIWYAVRQKYMMPIIYLVPIDEALGLSGGMDFPRPVRLESLTDVYTLLRTNGATEEQLIEHFGEEQVKRMRPRVLQRMVHPRKRR